MPELFGSEYGRLGIDTGDATSGAGADVLYDGALKVNRNFLEIYETYGDGSVLPLPGTVGKWDQNSVGITTLKNVGIGTTNPTSTLTVEGNVLVSGVSTIGNFRITPVGSGATIGGIGITYYGDGSNLTGTILNTIQNIDNNQIYYPVLSPIISGTISSISVSSDSIVFNPGTNSLGIGSTQPTTRLDIVGDAKISGILTATNLTVSSTLNVRSAIDLADSDVLRFGDADDVRVFYDGTANDLEIELEAAANQIAITDNGTYKVVIKKDGSVGIGSTLPTQKLTVLGSIGVGGSLVFNDSAGISTVIVAIGTERFIQHSIIDCGEY